MLPKMIVKKFAERVKSSPLQQISAALVSSSFGHLLLHCTVFRASENDEQHTHV